MKNSYKKIVLFLILITSTFSLIIPNVNAENKIFSLDSVKVSDKSYNVGLTKLKVVEDSITNDMFFNKVGDYITYDVVVTNNSNNNYTIRKITDDSNNGYISYDYDKYKDQVVKSGESINLKIKATYSKQSPEKLLSNTPVNFNIIYDDGKLINPKTMNNLLRIIMLILIVTIITVFFKIKEKQKFKAMILLLGLYVLLPIITKASSNIYTFTLNNNVSEKTIALLDTGKNVNRRMKELATGQTLEWKYNDSEDYFYLSNSETDADVYEVDSIKKFVETDIDHYNLVKDSLTENNIVSLTDSGKPVYIWYENNNIYMYSEADEILLNEDSSYLLYYLSGVDEVSFNNFVTSNVNNMEYLFASCYDNDLDINMDLSSWDTSNVTNMNGTFWAFGRVANSVVLNLDNWNTENVANMNRMFYLCGQHSPKLIINGISDFDVNKVEDMSFMFSYTGELSTDYYIGDLSNWDVGNVKNMDAMFEGTGNYDEDFSIGNLSNWNTEKVENMNYMFSYVGGNATNFTLGDLSNWDVSNVRLMTGMFSETGYNSTSWAIGDLSKWDTRKVEDMYAMFAEAGENATTWESIGTLNIYASDIGIIFEDCQNAKAVLNIYSNPSLSNYNSENHFFTNAAIKEGSGIIVNYSSRTEHIDDFIASKSDNSNVVKGSLLD